MRADSTTAPTWPRGPAGALPRTVAPFRGETVGSYLDRLAHANHLKPTQLRRYLTDTRTDCFPDQDWLATASHQPLQLLRARLIGLTDPDQHPTRQRSHARPACRLCMARRGIQDPVYCWFPDHVTVCWRHHRWIGPGTRTHDDQRDLRDAPAVMPAARRHARLHRDHRDATRCAISDATRILRWWTATPAPTFATATTCVEGYLRIYPDLIDVASILADVRREIFGTPAATVARCRAIDSVTSRLAIRFPEYRDQPRPIEQWISDQQIISAGLHRLRPAGMALHDDDGRPLRPRGDQPLATSSRRGRALHTHNACNASGRTR